MEYIPRGNGKWIEVDEVKDTSRVIVKSDLENQLNNLIEKNSHLNKITDEELLEWARENYRHSKDAMEYQNNLQKIANLSDLISKLI